MKDDGESPEIFFHFLSNNETSKEKEKEWWKKQSGGERSTLKKCFAEDDTLSLGINTRVKAGEGDSDDFDETGTQDGDDQGQTCWILTEEVVMVKRYELDKEFRSWWGNSTGRGIIGTKLR
ncbi:hypothetical protein L2E82_30173 [Cichorium intybus]|uniref:Uncharacterized protein n=1 Tax=Cichorium intybus TaxID=13427 RepID=A0ACB9CZJ9_CICIN|nr:hypothetical protein L2E82_30173 [Cichorium intybus]